MPDCMPIQMNLHLFFLDYWRIFRSNLQSTIGVVWRCKNIRFFGCLFALLISSCDNDKEDLSTIKDEDNSTELSNPDKESEQLQESAKAGNADAQFVLGVMHVKSDLPSINYEQALNWFTQAANQEHAKAQFYLGAMYENGRGVEIDHAKAIKWFTSSAENGYPIAQNHLGWMLANGKGIAQDHEKAVYWFRKAAEKKYSVAQANLSTMYRDGKGVRSDLRLARTWWNLALEGDSDSAFKEVGFNVFQLSRLTEIDSIE